MNSLARISIVGLALWLILQVLQPQLIRAGKKRSTQRKTVENRAVDDDIDWDELMAESRPDRL